MKPGSNVVFTFLLVAALSAAALFYFGKQSETKEKIRLQTLLNETTEAKQKLETDLQELRASTAALEDKVKSQDNLIADVKHTLDEQQMLRQKAETDAAAKQSEIDGLKDRLQKAETERRETESKLEKQYEDYFNMKTQLQSLLKTKEELEAKAKELAENGPVSLGTVVIRRNS